MALRDEIIDIIIQRASELFGKEPGELSEGTRFVEDLAAKSVNFVQIISVLEDKYDVELNYMDFRRKKTFGEAADFVMEVVGE